MRQLELWTAFGTYSPLLDIGLFDCTPLYISLIRVHISDVFSDTDFFLVSEESQKHFIWLTFQANRNIR